VKKSKYVVKVNSRPTWQPERAVRKSFKQARGLGTPYHGRCTWDHRSRTAKLASRCRINSNKWRDQEEPSPTNSPVLCVAWRESNKPAKGRRMFFTAIYNGESANLFTATMCVDHYRNPVIANQGAGKNGQIPQRLETRTGTWAISYNALSQMSAANFRATISQTETTHCWNPNPNRSWKMSVPMITASRPETWTDAIFFGDDGFTI